MVRGFGIIISSNGRPNGELSPEQRFAIICAYGAKAFSKLAAEFGCTRSTIYSTWNSFQQHHIVKSLPRSG